MKQISLVAGLMLQLFMVHAQQPSWRFATGGRVVASAVVSNGVIYIGSEDSCLYALDQGTGKMLWKCKTSAPIRSDAALGDKLVYVYSSNGQLLALDKTKGSLAWSYSFTPETMIDIWDYYLSAPVYNNGIVYIANSDGKVYAFAALSGRFKWDYASDGPIHGTISIDSNRLYAGNFAGVLFALNANNGRLLWKFKTVGDAYFPKGEIQKGPLVEKGTVYFGSRDYNIYALDGAKGTGKWNMKEGGSWVIAKPIIYQDNLYFGTSDSHVFYCMGKDYGQVKWKLPLNMRVYGSAVAKDSLVYFGCFNGILYGVHYRTGEIGWKFQTDGSRQNWATVYDDAGHFIKAYEDLDYIKKEDKILQLGSILATPLIDNNTIYFGSTDHNFYAVPLQQ